MVGPGGRDQMLAIKSFLGILEVGEKQWAEEERNTPGTRISPGFRDQTLARKSREKENKYSRDYSWYRLPRQNAGRKSRKSKNIPSSYAKIWGPIKFQLPDNPRSGWKAMRVKERERERRRAKVSVNNGQYIVHIYAWTKIYSSWIRIIRIRIANATTFHNFHIWFNFIKS